MKQFLLIACGILAIVATCRSQKVNIPAPVTNAFNAKYPNATAVKWGKESAKEYEAEFKLNGANVSANFDLDGSWIETETTIPSSGLPAAVISAVNIKYPGAVYFLTERIEKPGGKTLYEVNIKVKGKKKELELDGDGNLAE
ncbi:MAG: PepSY-like domain-containing protein [Chitinophagaceae bacterium]